MTPDQPRVLLFAPNARLWLSYRLQMSLAQAWSDSGVHVTVVGCHGLYQDLCPVMLASHVGPGASLRQRRSYCRECTSVSGLAAKHLDIEYIDIDSFITPEVRAQVDAELAGISTDSWMSFEFDGVPFGRYASYLSMLTYKSEDVSRSADAWAAYEIDLRNSLLTYLASVELGRDIQPTYALVYDRLYPVHRAFAVAMRRIGVPAVGMSVGAFVPRRGQTIVFHPFPHAGQTLVDAESVRASREITLSSAEIHDVAAHLSHLIAGNDPWVYSTTATRCDAREIRRELGLDATSRVGVVLVGSPDETRSSLLVDAEFDRGKGTGVSDVVEFVQTCVAAARNSPDVSIVIRLHPRLAPNKRERVTSPDLGAIQEVLANLPSNVVVNSPGDGISLYDVLRIADFGVNHGSTSGVEFLAFGVPVIHVDPNRLNAYPPDLGPCIDRHDVDGLAQALSDVTHAEWSLERAVAAWRWLATVLLRIAVQQAPIGTAEFLEPTDAAATSDPRPSLRQLVPTTIREQVSRRMAWKDLSREISAELRELSVHQESWAGESWTRFVQACEQAAYSNDNDGASSLIWEPGAQPRGALRLGRDDEREQVLMQLRRLASLLGPITGEGSGALSQMDSD